MLEGRRCGSLRNDEKLDVKEGRSGQNLNSDLRVKCLGLLTRVPRDSGGLSLSLVEQDMTCL